MADDLMRFFKSLLYAIKDKLGPAAPIIEFRLLQRTTPFSFVCLFVTLSSTRSLHPSETISEQKIE